MPPDPAESGTDNAPVLFCHKKSLGFLAQAEFVEGVHGVDGSPVLEAVPPVDIQDGLPVDPGYGLDVRCPCMAIDKCHGLSP